MTHEQNKRKRLSVDSVELCADTTIEQETFSFLWKLQSYTALSELSEVRSPIFIGGKTSHKWQLKLYPKHKFGPKDYVSVYLMLIDFGEEHSDGAIKARFEISLLKTNGLPGKQIGETGKTLEFAKGSDFGGKKKKSKERLAQDFERIFRESAMTDISIATSDDCFFLAHKVVLSADVVKGMLEYLYTGETESMPQQAPDLLRIADKYDLPGLKEDYEQTICDNLTVENAAEMLNLAHLHQARILKKCVLDYINW